MTDRSLELSAADLALCAHDLRGILTVIAGYSALLRRDDLDEAARQAAHDGIDAAIARADALVGDTLAGQVDARRAHERIDLSAAALRAAADTRAATGRDVTLEAEAGVTVDVDGVALARVLDNILANAAKYAPDGPIGIRVTTQGSDVVVEVSDRGPGIPADERDAVFEPFARLDRDAGKPGSGLGLVVVRSAVERMGGRVSLLDNEGGGTIVRIELPLAS